MYYTVIGRVNNRDVSKKIMRKRRKNHITNMEYIMEYFQKISLNIQHKK